MVRQYRIHTDLDGSNNKIYDMTNGLIRFYQPSDLGIINSTNIWQSQGIGVMGNNNISHPDIDFKFETFGNSLEENYRIFNEFINSIIKEKYITLEYTNEIGTFYADIQLSKITKTEGYGFDGQFSESISFIPVNMWYQYEQLKFSKVQNGEIGGNTKIYGNKETTVYPNSNLLINSSAKTKDGFFKNFDKVENGYGEVTLKGTNTWVSRSLGDGFSIQPRDYKPNDKYTMSMDVMFTSWNLPAGTTIAQFWIGQRYTQNSAGTIGVWKMICSIDLPRDPSNMLNQWIRITKTSTIPPYADPAVNTEALFQAKFTGASEGSFTFRVRKPKQEFGSIATPHMPSASEVTTADYRDYGSYKYDYTYFGEDNIERFSKWKIDDGIFSFTARMTPSQNLENMSDYGVRFLDEQFNEYTALIFGNTTKPDSIQFNTDVNDEYYQAQIGTSTINMFSALNYQRFRTRLIQKGTMELINVDVVEMNVKRKVDFV